MAYESTELQSNWLFATDEHPWSRRRSGGFDADDQSAAEHGEGGLDLFEPRA